jgi:hypothetical protein
MHETLYHFHGLTSINCSLADSFLIQFLTLAQLPVQKFTVSSEAPTVFVVDDDAAARRSLAPLLRAAGYQSTGGDAVTLTGSVDMFQFLTLRDVPATPPRSLALGCGELERMVYELTEIDSVGVKRIIPTIRGPSKNTCGYPDRRFKVTSTIRGPILNATTSPLYARRHTSPKISVFRIRGDELPVRPGQFPGKWCKCGRFRRL